ncbi:hypothetical protein FQN55_004128 [Onygenales sp. PD_40]|nr:hypothetical protein FQN55_004128 [Onygenales sp. PD_40]KAK2773230.1 hypothetical protein FQN53_004207 [Emmonsiellopsis sp. PD_33]KAK2789492.1 hypothetical protein FQN52_006020 [Onygenales sp. PD_12]KAK2798592.1 hypothetical protein FQN51_007612 [Onygenales sp. PD_10]
MKSALFLSAAAAVAGLAHAGHHQQHNAFHKRGYETAPPAYPEPTCGCTTKVITYYGEETIIEEPTTTIHTTSTTTKTVTVTPEPELPTPIVTVYPTPGTYTIPAKTIVVTKETTVCGATSTSLSPGDHTYGGVTTVVETATTVTCPVAVVKPTGSTSTSVIEQTTYVCPSAGTYTIAPSTTNVPKSTVLVYPTPASYTPGTYTQPAQTVTAIETDYVYVCPNPTGELPAPTTTAAPAPPPKETYTPAPKPKPTPETPSLGGGDKWGMTYSPYTDGGECKGAIAVAADIALIKLKGFKTVRVYSTDCDGLQNIGNACKLNGLNMILGVFVSGSGIEEAKKQVKDIVSWGKFDMVDLIVVGNEALFQGVADSSSLVGLIQYASSAFKAGGYTGPVTTTEPLNIWQQYGSQLCGSIDVIGANIHCFFNSEVTAPSCGKFVKGQMDILGKICPGKEVFTLETGWPNAGDNNGKAIAGKDEQAQAIKSIIKEVGSHSVFFSFTDDLWKNPGAYNVEQHWGCGDLF